MNLLPTRPLFAAAILAGFALPALAQDASVTMHAVDIDGIGAEAGTIAFTDSDHGLLIEPDLQGLPAGLHGLHVHQNPDCGPGPNDSGETVAAGAAGGHHDPEDTGIHAGPYGDGHLGDLPNLMVLEDGSANLPLLAPRLTVADLAGRAVVIHDMHDDYTDAHPGGSRSFCGVVE